MKNSTFFLILLLFFTGFGTLTSILVKYLSLEKSKGVVYSHNWFFNVIMFFAEMMGIPLYYLIKCYQKPKKKQNEFKELEDKPNEELINNESAKLSKIKKILLLGFPFIFDTCASFIGSISLVTLPGSFFNMIKGVAIIIITFFISKYYFKKEYKRHHYISMGVSVVGFIILGLSAFFGENKDDYDEDEKEALKILFTISMVLIAMVFQAIQFSLEENYMKKYKFHPILFIGVEGLFGFIFNIILCFIFYFIKCGSDPPDIFSSFCTQDSDGIWRFENIFFAFEQIFDNYKIIIYLFFIIISIFGFNMFGTIVINHGGAMARGFIEYSRIITIWIYFLLPFVNNELREKFNWIKLVGLICIFCSLIIYLGLLIREERLEIKKKLDSSTNEQKDIYEKILDNSGGDKSILSINI